MKEIILVRHAESRSNTGEIAPHRDGDHHIALTEIGLCQAHAVGYQFSKYFLQAALIYCSPFLRAQETLTEILRVHELSDLRVREDVLLREQDRGYEPEDQQMPLRRTHGWFWYRHAGGESPADCYQRVCIFLESLYRELERTGANRVFIVTHGMTIRCFVMRFLHLSVKAFESMKNPDNCAVIRLHQGQHSERTVFTNNSWVVEGLELRE